MRTKAMRDIVDIEQQTIVRGDNGTTETKWLVVASGQRCRITPVVAMESWKAGQVTADCDHVVEMRARGLKVKPSDRLVDKIADRVLEIKGVIDIDNLGREYRLDCREEVTERAD